MQSTTGLQKLLSDESLRPAPLTEIEFLGRGKVRVLLKREWDDTGADPLRSIKRKPARLVFEEAGTKGYLTENIIVVTATSGNFGIDVARQAVAAGHRFVAVTPYYTPETKIRMLVSLGIDVVRTHEQDLCPREFTVFYVRNLANELHHKLLNLDQYFSWQNPLSHLLTTGPEILGGAGGPVDHVVAPIGSGGTLSGIGAFFSARSPETQLIGVQPQPKHAIPGVHIVKGECKWSPENYSPLLTPTIESESDLAAYAFTAKLWAEGFPVGPSTGMAAAQVQRLVDTLDPRDECTIVFLSPDSDFKYPDLIQDNLRKHRDGIRDTYPKFLSATDDYIDALRSRSLEDALAMVRESYKPPREGTVVWMEDFFDEVYGSGA